MSNTDKNNIVYAITQGNLYYIDEKIDFLVLRDIFIEQIKGGTFVRNTGWINRLISNVSYYIRSAMNTTLIIDQDFLHTLMSFLKDEGLNIHGVKLEDLFYNMYIVSIKEDFYKLASKDLLIDILKCRKSQYNDDQEISKYTRIWVKVLAGGNSEYIKTNYQLFYFLVSNDYKIITSDNSLAESLIWSDIPFTLKDNFTLKQELNTLLIEKLRDSSYSKRIYESYIQILKKSDLSFTDIEALHEKDPNFVLKDVNVSEIVSLGLKYWNLNKLPDHIKAYILGFPININFPSFKILQNAIFKLKELGIEGYVAYIKKIFPHLPQNYEDLGLSRYNDVDLLEKDNDELNSFDVVTLIDSNKIYEFTRSAWYTLLQKGTNPYTRNPLPSHTIMEISNRLLMSKKFSLPIYDTLDILISEAFENTLNPPQEDIEENQRLNENPRSVPLTPNRGENIQNQLSVLDMNDQDSNQIFISHGDMNRMLEILSNYREY